MAFEWLKRKWNRYISKGGAEIATGKSLVDALGVDGSATTDTHEYNEGSIGGQLHGLHSEIVILFIVPDADPTSLGVENAAMLATLQTLAGVVVIQETDANTYPDWQSYALCICGSPLDTAWDDVGSNLGTLKLVPNLPIVCVDKDAAIALGICKGVGGGVNASIDTIKTKDNIKGSMIGAGYHERSGFAENSANVVYTEAGDIAYIDTTDAPMVGETIIAFEDGTDDRTKDVVMIVHRVQGSGDISTDVDGLEIDASMAFFGPGLNPSIWNTLGEETFYILCEIFIHEQTTGIALTISGEIGDLLTKLLGNMKNLFNNAGPLSDYLAGSAAGTGTKMPNGKSLYDIMGAADGATLNSLFGILGDPAQTFLAMIGYEGGTSLADKLTATRAGYLDQLDFDLQGLLNTIAGYIDAEIDSILTIVNNLPNSGSLNDLSTILTAIQHATYGLSQLRIEIDANETKIDTVDTVVDGIQTDLSNVTDGLGALKALIDAIPTTMVGTDGAALASSWTAALATALGNYTAVRAGYLDELGSANIPTDVDAILTDTAEIGAAGAGLSAIPWNTVWDAEVQSEVIDGLNAYDPPTRAEATSDKDEILAATASQSLLSTSIATLASQVSFTLTVGSADNGAYVGLIVVITDAATSTQKCVGIISAYTGSSRTITLREDPGVFTIAVTDTVDIVAINPDVPLILADTNELQGDWINGGRLDLILDIIAADVVNIDGAVMRGTDSAALASSWTAALATALGNYTAVRAGYLDELAAGNLPTDVSNVQTAVDGIQTDLSNVTDGLGALKSLIDTLTVYVDTEVASILAVTDNLPNSGSLNDLATILTAIQNATYGLSQLRIEIDANETKIDTVDTVVDGIQTDLSNVTDGLGALKALIDAIPTTMVGTDGAALASSWTAALATALGNYTAVRAGYLDQLDFNLQEDIAALQTDLDNPSQYKADLTTLETRLSATRAGYLDELAAANLPTDVADVKTVADGIQTDLSNVTDGLGALKALIDAIPTTMVGTDGAALASSWTAALATALGNYTAVRAGYLDQLDFNLQEDIAALQTDLDNPSQYKADLTTLETRLSAARAGYLDELDAGNLPTDVSNVKTVVDGIQTDLSNVTDGLGALKTLIDAIPTAGGGLAPSAKFYATLNLHTLSNYCNLLHATPMTQDELIGSITGYEPDHWVAAWNTNGECTVKVRLDLSAMAGDDEVTVVILEAVDGSNYAKVSSDTYLGTDLVASDIFVKQYTISCHTGVPIKMALTVDNSVASPLNIIVTHWAVGGKAVV